MNFYSSNLLPRLMDWSMSGRALAKYRQEVLADVRGEVLEIGFGSGLNLEFYPEQIKKIVTVEPNTGMSAIAQKRIEQSSINVESCIGSGENITMPDNTFDSVVSTWTLCSITKVEKAIQEIYRVLKPGGKFFFIEHGLSKDPKLQVWQNRLTPIQKVIADGCHLNRNILNLIEREFTEITIKEFQVDGLLKVGGYFYQGVATKS
ncbi:methylase involved in ubiquinone/menaquinone biosynthesis (plasmid) [Synechococcus sp. PCC 7502]|uniref:class I SAM-dependent methyltransferase n=1 Tax=Synechococcus sp. PCC 7502 TaxID=1173263 RepID=UPI00029FB27B|nr:class I SAM-dependent methyltransferase [Synechococcus sp. PCC 7502]AFY75436.1 methylase involved in ubiquinone/menaquinone biosynthesis [Synechococcus sp. PCC 7502]